MRSRKGRFSLVGDTGSVTALYIAGLFSVEKKMCIVVLPDDEDVFAFQSDLRNLLPASNILYFPSSYKKTYNGYERDKTNTVLRTETVNQLLNGNTGIVVATATGIFEKVVSRQNVKRNTFEITKNQLLDTEKFFYFLEINSFIRTDFVYEPGEFAIRGGIMDVFPFNTEKPFRISLDDDRVASLRVFEIDTQISTEEVEKISLIPDFSGETTSTCSLLEYIADDSYLVLKQALFVLEISEDFSQNIGTEEHAEDLFSTREKFIRLIQNHTIIEYGGSPLFRQNEEITLQTEKPPKFTKDLLLINDYLHRYYLKGYQLIFCAESEKQFHRFNLIVQENTSEISLSYLQISFSTGFTDHQLKICLLTDHEVFSRYHQPVVPGIRQHRSEHLLNDLKELKPGDYLVHIDYGIGRFAGLEKIDNDGKEQEVIRILYKDNDLLYVGIHSLYKVSKYRGAEGTPPTIHKLGSKVWANLKAKTKKKVKDIAKDLIKLYAKRKQVTGFSFSHDTVWQQELEASFFFEDTPDQLKATEDVKIDMESNIAMDRLICGDVGFGKTEIAIRAAFKALVNGKQVAVLVPTTILALQHYKTFLMRLKELPCNVDYISRFKSTAQQKDTLARLAEGKIDIIIGTHRVASKDVKFKDLGLLIIDEEQKFGVRIKEKLRQIKPNVDTLTLTATPIPRTLQFSLMGARDISIINTPPPNRMPIHTEIQPLEIELIRKAILFEVNRNGQVFFINNRIQNIAEIEVLLNKHIPEVKTVVAHGQMAGSELERIMWGFIGGEFDVLISTSIVESGLDIPSVNTIIINDAHHFGLSDLHQLRGRVGRTNVKAFCYLITPPVSLLPRDARRKLTALVEFSELGSGFNIALQDLEIRGAGNLLGAEQSGFINEIGMETYQKILEEAVSELRHEDVTAEEIYKSKTNDKHEWVNDCIIDTNFRILLPDEYISSSTERLKLYKALNKINTKEELASFREQLIDRFGKLPTESEDLLTLVKVRWQAMSLGIEKIILKNNSLRATFTKESTFFQSEIFGKILSGLSAIPNVRLAEKNDKALLLKDNIENINDVSDLFFSLGLNK